MKVTKYMYKIIYENYLLLNYLTPVDDIFSSIKGEACSRHFGRMFGTVSGK